MVVGKLLYLQGAASTGSALLLIWWALVTFKYHRHEASPLHHFMTLALAFRLLDDLAITILYLLMQADANINQATLLMSVTCTLYRTFLYTSLLLLSKGFATLRHTITRTELTGFTLASGLLYVSLSLYMLQPRSLLFLFLLVLVLVLFYCSRFLATTLSRVQHQLELYGRMQLPDLLVGCSLKLELLRSFQALCSLYFLLELAYIVLLQANLGHGFTLEAAHTLLELLLVGLIFWSFRARPFSHLFRIGDVESGEEDDWQPPVLFKPRPQHSALQEHCPVLVQLSCHGAPLGRFEVGLLEDTA